MTLQLDGGNTIIGTEFIKLEITGTSNLATEAFVNTAVANGGGGGGGDLTNYYDKTEVDNLIVNKVNKDNPQDRSGTLRIGHLLGTSKIILNAVSSTKDFYVSGDAEINGNCLATSINSNSFIQGSSVLTTEIDTGSNANLDIQRNNVSAIELQDGLTILKTKTECRDAFCCDLFENEPLSQIITHVMNESTGQIRYYVGNPAVPDTTTNLVMTLKTDKIEINKPAVLSDELQTNVIDSYGISDITFKRNTFDICYLKNNAVELNAGINLVAPAQVQANTYNSFDDSSALFLRNGAEFMRFRKTEDDILMSKDINGVNLTLTGEVKSNVLNSNGLNNIVFKRNDVSLASLTANDFMTESNKNLVSPGQVKSNIFNSYGDIDPSFRRYNDEYIAFKSNPLPITIPLVEIPGGKGFMSDQIYTSEIRSRTLTANMRLYGANSAGTGRVNFMQWTRANEDITFYRNVIIDASYSLSVDLLLGTDVRSDTCYSDTFRNKTLTSDTFFLGANVAGDGRTSYMIYRRLTEDLRILKDVLIDAGFKIQSNIYDSSDNNDVYLKRNAIDYIQLGGVALRTRLLTGCQSDIYDSLGNSDVSYRRNGIDFFYLRNGQVELNTGITLTGELVDTSDKTKKYDIKDIETKMTDIVKSIKPKTLKMIDEKEKGINKNHIGFVADDLLDVIPNEWQNIVSENDKGIKQLNYVKMNAILWGVCREQQSKIEHLESRLFEVENFIKDFVKAKPKAKAKAKN